MQDCISWAYVIPSPNKAAFNNVNMHLAVARDPDPQYLTSVPLSLRLQGTFYIHPRCAAVTFPCVLHFDHSKEWGRESGRNDTLDNNDRNPASKQTLCCNVMYSAQRKNSLRQNKKK